MSIQKVMCARLDALRRLLRKEKVNACLVTDRVDQFYLSGFSFYPGEAVMIVYPAGVVCVARELYVEPLTKAAPHMHMIGCDTDRLGKALEYIKQHKFSHVGFDAAKTAYLEGKRMLTAGLVELPSLVAQLRERKDAVELKKLRQANRIAYQAYEYVRPRIKTGMMECEVALMLEQFMRTQGATGTSFATIVAFGENASNPHHETSTRKLKKEDAILMDYGCIYDGYCSDITRCWWHGQKEPALYTKIWKIVDKARRSGIKTIGVGVPSRQVDAQARGVIEAAGYGEFFTHRTGHGVGIDIHEEPCNSADATARLQAGNVVTVEPGIYLPGQFGIRLEDTLAVGPKGAIILTKK